MTDYWLLITDLHEGGRHLCINFLYRIKHLKLRQHFTDYWLLIADCWLLIADLHEGGRHLCINFLYRIKHLKLRQHFIEHGLDGFNGWIER